MSHKGSEGAKCLCEAFSYFRNKPSPTKRQEQRAKVQDVGFPGGTVVKNPPANAGDTSSSPSMGGSHMLRSN